MNQPRQQQLRQQKQMSTATPFTMDQVIAQAGILQGALNTAFGHGSTYIKDLKAQIAAGQPVTQAQLDQLGNLVGAMQTATSDFDVTNTEPVIPIPPPQPAV